MFAIRSISLHAKKKNINYVIHSPYWQLLSSIFREWIRTSPSLATNFKSALNFPPFMTNVPAGGFMTSAVCFSPLRYVTLIWNLIYTGHPIIHTCLHPPVAWWSHMATGIGINTVAGMTRCLTTPGPNSLRPSDAYMRRWIGSSLVQIMACRMFCAKPLSEPMREYC